MILGHGALLNNRYRILEILGQGGMGSVYRALDENLGVDVAVKDNLFTTDEYARQFWREATILATLRHPNLPRVTDHFVIDGQGQYLVMDYIDGEDLRQRMERSGPLSAGEVITIGAAVCDALTYLGTRTPPVIHRDIKPGNVRITPQGNIYVVDFGLAKTMHGSHITTTGARAMTPGYSPPEQYGTARTDQRSDIFSLGATLFAALTGIIPEDALARAMDQEELTHIHEHNPQISEQLAAVIEKALEVRPENRYQNAQEFKGALLTVTFSPQSEKLGESLQVPLESAEESLPIKPVMPADAKPSHEEKALKVGESPQDSSIPEDINNAVKYLPFTKPRNRRRISGCWVGTILIGIILGAGLYGFFLLDPAFPSRVSTQLIPWIDTLGSRLIGIISNAKITTEKPVNSMILTPLPQIITSTSTTTFTPDPTFTPVSTLTFRPTLQPTLMSTLKPTPIGGGGGQIAFASNATGINQVYIINVDGTNLTRVTNLAEGACQPSWSSDGLKLVFTSPCNLNKDYYPGSSIFIINVDGSGLLPVPSGGRGDYDPEWSPDGNRIAFTSLRNNGRPQIYIFSVLDNSVVGISSKYAMDNNPSWSADGNHLIYTSSINGVSEIWIMDANGENPRKYSKSSTLLDFNPSWSPDGTYVLFTQYTALGGIPRIMIADYTNENYFEYELGQDVMPMREGIFSPDGYWIAYEGWLVGGSHDIYIITVGGAGRQQVTVDTGDEFDPGWKPVP